MKPAAVMSPFDDSIMFTPLGPDGLLFEAPSPMNHGSPGYVPTSPGYSPTAADEPELQPLSPTPYEPEE